MHEFGPRPLAYSGVGFIPHPIGVSGEHLPYMTVLHRFIHFGLHKEKYNQQNLGKRPCVPTSVKEHIDNNNKKGPSCKEV